MNSTPVDTEEEVFEARRLCEADAWPEVLDFARAWQAENPTDYRALYYMALGHTGLGQFVQAETAYRRALELDNSDAKVWSNLGGLLYEHLKRHVDGIRCVEQALKLNPTHKLGWANLAYMVGRLGHYHHAMTFADKALALDSELVEAYLHKGAAAKALGKNEVLREVCGALSALPPEKFHRAR
ncbi:MAG TPA: tetratricopeptide repeat protein [Verrucomicrobiae bacterium]|jgi:tetratricopeptide (TPR) repeat protein|nr:tetratricopeptide repeat protein [Verrucomicrobiae bacterium]